MPPHEFHRCLIGTAGDNPPRCCGIDAGQHLELALRRLVDVHRSLRPETGKHPLRCGLRVTYRSRRRGRRVLPDRIRTAGSRRAARQQQDARTQRAGQSARLRNALKWMPHR
jgi:hypothetical protein